MRTIVISLTETEASTYIKNVDEGRRIVYDKIREAQSELRACLFFDREDAILMGKAIREELIVNTSALS